LDTPVWEIKPCSDMKKIIGLKPATIIDIISALFILLFVYTAINKFMAMNTLKFVLKDYPLIGGMPTLFAWTLPITELIVTLWLFIPRFRLLGLYSSLALMTAFTLYLSYMLTFTTKLPCTCGGMLQKLSWPQHLMFNIFFIALATIAIKLYRKRGKQKEETEITPIAFT
jgi:putative oxidoreductase